MRAILGTPALRKISARIAGAISQALPTSPSTLGERVCEQHSPHLEYRTMVEAVDPMVPLGWRLNVAQANTVTFLPSLESKCPL